MVESRRLQPMAMVFLLLIFVSGAPCKAPDIPETTSSNPGGTVSIKKTPIDQNSGADGVDKTSAPWLANSDLTLLSPRDWQVFQRQTRLEGRMMISGRVAKPCKRV